MKKAFVLGLGVSGRAAATFLLRQGYAVTGADAQPCALPGITVISDQDHVDWQGIELLVVSPGVDPRHRLYCAARQAGVEILGEAELAFRYLKQPAVAITGTNGKTTVTLLTAHVLHEAGIRARALGNVGTAFSTYLLEPDPDEVIVAELSSFQLETLTTPAFAAGVILNITPNHFDRHTDLEGYAAAKCRLQGCLKTGAPFYVQKETADLFPHLLKKGTITYGYAEGSELKTDKVVAKYGENVEYFLPVRYRDLGVHESENALAAWALCKCFGVSGEQFLAALETFQKPPHRIEFVAQIKGVSFFDDSKGTNIDAVIRAVEAMPGPTVLIVGGKDKGASYLPWKDPFMGKVKRMIAIGQAAPLIERDLGPYFEMERVETLGEAVTCAMQGAREGDCVLLSPGCSSYDQFRDYAHRGEEFQRFVNELKRR